MSQSVTRSQETKPLSADAVLEIELATAVLFEFAATSAPPGDEGWPELDEAIRVLRKSRYLREACGKDCVLA